MYGKRKRRKGKEMMDKFKKIWSIIYNKIKHNKYVPTKEDKINIIDLGPCSIKLSDLKIPSETEVFGTPENNIHLQDFSSGEIHGTFQADFDESIFNEYFKPEPEYESIRIPESTLDLLFKKFMEKEGWNKHDGT